MHHTLLLNGERECKYDPGYTVARHRGGAENNTTHERKT